MHGTSNTAERAALRCLAHPAVWLAIKILMLNDHVGKAVYPGWRHGSSSPNRG